VASGELRGLSVNLWHSWTGAEGLALQTLLDEFNRTNRWGITVNSSAYDGFGSLDEAVEAGLSSGDVPDIVVDYGYQARHWDNQDALVDLFSYVDDPVWGLTSDEQADFIPEFWVEDLVTEDFSADARRLGIPYYRAAYTLFYNQGWARELGFTDPPESLQSLRLRACAAAESVASQEAESSPGKGGLLLTSQPGSMVGWIYAFGGEITNPEADGYRFSTPQAREAFEYLKDLQYSGCAWSDTEVEAAAEFANRRALLVAGSLLDIPAMREAFHQAGSSDEWVVIPFPSQAEPVVEAYGPSIMIMRSNPARQLAAWLVTEWLVYPPNQAVWVQALGAYPTRTNTLNYLNRDGNTSPQWVQALELLPTARSEPSLASWSMVRWALADATGKLFDPQLEGEQIPALLEQLDSIAAELVSQVR